MAITRTWTKKTVALAAAAALTVAGAGAAFAYWTSTGSGDGSATTGNSVAFDVTVEAAAGVISPDGAGQTIDFTVSNPGPGTQNLSAVTATLATADGVAWVPTGDCDIADYTVTVTTPPTYGPLAAEASVDGTVGVTLASTAVNQDDCQNQVVPVYIVAS